MDVRSHRVSSTRAWRRVRSDISSGDDVKLWVGTTRLGVMSLVTAVLALAAAFILGVPATGLGAAVGLGSGFSVLAAFLVAVTLSCSWTFVTD
jgi:hypothetical protein